MELMNAGECGKVVLYMDEAEMEAAERKRRERQTRSGSPSLSHPELVEGQGEGGDW